MIMGRKDIISKTMTMNLVHDSRLQGWNYSPVIKKQTSSYHFDLERYKT